MARIIQLECSSRPWTWHGREEAKAKAAADWHQEENGHVVMDEGKEED